MSESGEHSLRDSGVLATPTAPYYILGPRRRPSFFRSSASFLRPVAALFLRSSSSPITRRVAPEMVASIDPYHASANVTPEISPMRSMRFGGCPNWVTILGSSSARLSMTFDGAPKSMSAAQSDSTLRSVGR
jgi:hypothetical protein